MRTQRRLIRGVLGLCLVLGMLVTIAPPASAAFTQPSFLRSVGGRGEPGVYAWGIQYNPVSNEIVVGDYLNFQIRRYDLNGNYLGSFYRPNSNGQPYSLAVDPRNGNIIVPELRDGGSSGIIAIYNKSGTFLKTITVSAQYWVWIATDNVGNLYIVDSHYWNSSSNLVEIYKYNLDTGSKVSGWPKAYSYGTGAGKFGRCYGIGVEWSTGNIYVADSMNKNVHVVSPSGTWLRDVGGPGEGVGQFASDLRGIAIDQTRRLLYVNDTDAGQVEAFNIAPSTPTPVVNWGSTGKGPGQFADGGRQLTVSPDGDVWDTDYGNWRFQRFTGHGTLKGIYPDPAQPAPTGAFSQPRGVAVDSSTGNMYVVDTWNERVQEFAPDGSFMGTWGQRASAEPYGFDYPRGIGFDNALGRLWVTNTRAHNIRRYNADMSFVDTLGSELNDSSSAGFFRWPVNVDFYNGKAYVADYNSGVIKILDANTGAELQQKSITNNGIAVDPATGNVYVVSWSTDKVTEYNPTLSTVIRTFGTRGSGDGQFQNPWGMTIVNDLLYVTDTQLSRVQVFDLNGNFVGKWGGLGTGVYQLNNPSGITHDAAGNLYVADAGNDRVQVYSTTVPKPTGDNRKPVVTITSPTQGATLPGGAVHVSGTATDNVGFGVAKVEVAVQNTDTGLWWAAGTATWGATKTFNQAPAAGTSITNMTYSFPFVGVAYNGHYHAEVQAQDVSSIMSATNPTVDFSTAGSPGDQLPPVTSFTAPVLDAIVQSGPVTMSGSTGDNVGVSQVQVAIMDRNTNRWYDPSTAVFVIGPRIWIPATVAVPGALETTWSYVFTAGGLGSGSYYALSRALDAAGNIETDSPFTRYSVAGAGDSVAPDTTMIAPGPGQAVPSGTVAITGDATDNIGVTSVDVAIRNDGTAEWWDGAAWGASQQWLSGTVFSPGGASTAWSYAWPSPGPGSYTAFARATDALVNTDASPASSSFTVLPPDTTMPTTTISAPAPSGSSQAPVDTSGTASDNAGVATVRVAIRNNATLQWWNGTGWGGGGSFALATLDNAGGTSTGWSYAFDPGITGNFGIQVRSVDTSGNIGANTAWRNFNVTAPGSDTTGPTIVLSTPTIGQVLPFGSVNVSGTSADETGVATVRVSIQNSATLQWWTGSGWQTATTFVQATLSAPAATSTGYSYSFDPGVSGNYAVQVRGVDTIGNLGTSTALRSFTIQPVYVDTTPPTTVVTAPLNNSSGPAPVSITGTATDDVGVTIVRISIKNNAAGQWWNGSGWGAFTFVTAVLDTPGGASTGWSYSFNPPATGGYGFQARSLDAAGNLGANTVWRNFTIV